MFCGEPITNKLFDHVTGIVEVKTKAYFSPFIETLKSLLSGNVTGMHLAFRYLL